MSSPPRIYSPCPDGTMCEHASACVSNPYDEGSYYCDCVNADYSSTVTGLYCEFIATSYCNSQKSESRIAFCANNGKCLSIVDGSQPHPGCECPKGYNGNHCEFVGVQPGGYPYDGSAAPALINYSPSHDGLRAGIKALIVIVVLFVVGLLGYVLYRKKRSSTKGINNIHKSTDSSLKSSSASLHLEPDGSSLMNDPVQDHAIMEEENGSSQQHPEHQHLNGGDEENRHAVQLI